MLHFLLIATIAATGLGLSGQDAASQTTPAAREDNVLVEGRKVDEQKKKVCKRAVSTGSIMTKSTCKTVAEWEIERERSMAFAEQRRQRALMEAETHREKYGN